MRCKNCGEVVKDNTVICPFCCSRTDKGKFDNRQMNFTEKPKLYREEIFVEGAYKGLLPGILGIILLFFVFLMLININNSTAVPTIVIYIFLSAFILWKSIKALLWGVRFTLSDGRISGVGKVKGIEAKAKFNLPFEEIRNIKTNGEEIEIATGDFTYIVYARNAYDASRVKAIIKGNKDLSENNNIF